MTKNYQRIVADFVFEATAEEAEAIEARLNADKTLLAKAMFLLTDRHPANVARDVGAWAEEVEWTHESEDETDGFWAMKGDPQVS